MSYIDKFIDKLNLTLEQVNKQLFKIKKSDIQAQQLKIKLEFERKKLLEEIEFSGEKRLLRQQQEINTRYHNIIAIQNQLVSVAKKKILLAEQLYVVVHEPTEELEKQLEHNKNQKVKHITWEDYQAKMKKKSKKWDKWNGHHHDKKQEYKDCINQPKYCYCSKPCFGQMVMCQNTYCQKQWFHLECIDIKKKLPQKWYCKDCQQKQGKVTDQIIYHDNSRQRSHRKNKKI